MGAGRPAGEPLLGSGKEGGGLDQGRGNGDEGAGQTGESTRTQWQGGGAGKRSGRDGSQASSSDWTADGRETERGEGSQIGES